MGRTWPGSEHGWLEYVCGIYGDRRNQRDDITTHSQWLCDAECQQQHATYASRGEWGFERYHDSQCKVYVTPFPSTARTQSANGETLIFCRFQL